MQDRWESLAALWPLGSPPAALPFLETRAHLPGTALVTQCTLSPGSSWSGGKGLAQRVMAEQVPPTSDSLDKSQTPEQGLALGAPDQGRQDHSVWVSARRAGVQERETGQTKGQRSLGTGAAGRGANVACVPGPQALKIPQLTSAWTHTILRFFPAPPLNGQSPQSCKKGTSVYRQGLQQEPCHQSSLPPLGAAE